MATAGLVLSTNVLATSLYFKRISTLLNFFLFFFLIYFLAALHYTLISSFKEMRPQASSSIHHHYHRVKLCYKNCVFVCHVTKLEIMPCQVSQLCCPSTSLAKKLHFNWAVWKNVCWQERMRRLLQSEAWRGSGQNPGMVHCFNSVSWGRKWNKKIQEEPPRVLVLWRCSLAFNALHF